MKRQICRSRIFSPSVKWDLNLGTEVRILTIVWNTCLLWVSCRYMRYGDEVVESRDQAPVKANTTFPSNGSIRKKTFLTLKKFLFVFCPSAVQGLRSIRAQESIVYHVTSLPSTGETVTETPEIWQTPNSSPPLPVPLRGVTTAMTPLST